MAKREPKEVEIEEGIGNVEVKEEGYEVEESKEDVIEGIEFE